MNSRSLRSLVDVLRRDETRNLDTGEVSDTYKPYHRKVPMAREDTSGGSTQRGDQIDERVSAVFRCRYFADISTADRIQDGSEQFAIVSVLDKDGQRRFLEVHCTRVDG